jgi:hypothetical protein
LRENALCVNLVLNGAFVANLVAELDAARLTYDPPAPTEPPASGDSV